MQSQTSPQRFRLAFNHVGEVPRCLTSHMTGLIAHLNLRLDDGQGVVDELLSGIHQALERDSLSVNPYALRSILFNLSNCFLKSMARIQTELGGIEVDERVGVGVDQAEPNDWGSNLRSQRSPVWILQSPFPPLRFLLIMELFWWCQLNKLVCEGGLPGVAGFSSPIINSLAQLRGAIRARQRNGELVLPMQVKERPEKTAKFNEKLAWTLQPLESYLEAEFDESLEITSGRLMLHWGAKEPNTFTKANFLNLLWFYVEACVSKVIVDPAEVFLLTYSIVERFDLL